MKNKILEKIIKFEKVAIVGFGKEGQSTYKFIRSLSDKKLTIIDFKNAYEIMPSLKGDDKVEVIYGEGYLDRVSEFDLIIKSPGLSFKLLDRDTLKEKITSQVELVLEVNRDNIIGVTGSKGKSTTSSLLYHLIKCQNKKTCLVGNIGVPVFDEIEQYTDETLVVMEISCNQLEFVKVSPHIGVITNIFQDHLDTIGSLDAYEKAKMNIFKYQEVSDIAVYDGDNDTIKRKLNEMSVNCKLLDVSFDNGKCYINDNKMYINGNYVIDVKDIKRNIQGMHNLKNIMLALCVIDEIGLDVGQAVKDIESFKPLEHRMEYVGTYNDISFYNDSIATIPEATIYACDTIENLDTLIFGGQDRGIDYDDFINYLNNSKIRNLICMPTTGYTIGEKIDSSKRNVFVVDTLEEAVRVAYEVTKRGGSCIMSPAAASYEYFKNFEEKGTKYKEYIDLYK